MSNTTSLTDKKIHEDITKYFTSPILFNSEVKPLSPELLRDMELIETNPANTGADAQSIYSKLCDMGASTVSNDIVAKQIGTHVTSDVRFLQNTQKIVEAYYPYEGMNPSSLRMLCFLKAIQKSSTCQENVTDVWKQIRVDSGHFKEHYQYIDIGMFEHVNKIPAFMLIMSVLNILSPLLSIILPILLFLLPFVCLFFSKQGSYTSEDMCDTFRTALNSHCTGRLLTINYGSSSPSDVVYAFASVGFFIYTIYQNVMSCARFISNLRSIIQYLHTIRAYCARVCIEFDLFSNIVMSTLPSPAAADEPNEYVQFVEHSVPRIETLREIHRRITECKLEEYTHDTSCTKMFQLVPQMGNIMSLFYELHETDVYHTSIMYSLGFCQYVEYLKTLSEKVSTGVLGKARFCESKNNCLSHKPRFTSADTSTEDVNNPEKETAHAKTSATTLTNFYHPCVGSTDVLPVKNNIVLNKTVVITGPNASGKTTLLKAACINIILSQQSGFGCYEDATIVPYTHFHSYINIPDTSDRDSLFQAEARRCKNILDSVTQKRVAFADTPGGAARNHANHLCIFDELYSGTNPAEAEASAFAFMKYLSVFRGESAVDCMLTTHYLGVCKRLEAECGDYVKNCQMHSQTITHGSSDADDSDDQEKTSIRHTYLLISGISEIVGGGAEVLRQLDYPSEIMEQLATQ